MKKYNNFLYVFLALTLILSTPGLSNLVINAHASVNINDIIGGYLDGMPSPGSGGNSWPWPLSNPDSYTRSHTRSYTRCHTRSYTRTNAYHTAPHHTRTNPVNNWLQAALKIKLLE